MPGLKLTDMAQPRNVKLLGSFVLLSAATVLVFYFINTDQSGVDKSIFKVADQNLVDKVTLTSPQANVELKFNGAKWIVNTNHPVDPQLATVFFATILQAEPKRKITSSKADSIESIIRKRGIRVTLWEGEKKEKEFWVCSNDQKTETYFQLEGDAPYLVSIPGYRVHVASIFELTENGWRDKRIFNFNWQNFKKLKAIFPQQPAANFTVVLANKLFSLEEVVVADTSKFSRYLETVFNLQAAQILSAEEKSRYDSLLGSTPVFQLEIEDIAKRNLSIKLYGNLKEESLVVGQMNEEVVLISRAAANAIAKPRDYFVLK
jgi:hypothetical protein